MTQLRRLMVLSALICSSLLCIGINTATANLVHNGSFESGSYKIPTPPSLDFNTLNAGSSAITGWTVISPTGGNIDWVGSYWQAADGNFSIDLNGNTTGLGGGIQQTISTAAGQQYKITFSMAANPDGGPSIKPMMVLGIGSNLFDVPFSIGSTSINWTNHEYIFTAGLSPTILTFLSQTPGYYGPVIDNVNVSAVPLPAAAWMLGAGLIWLVSVRRKQNM